MSVTVTTGVPESAQTAEFANATLQQLGPRHAASVELTLPPLPADVSPEHEGQLRLWLLAVLGRAVACGCRVEVRVGLDSDHEKEDGL